MMREFAKIHAESFVGLTCFSADYPSSFAPFLHYPSDLKEILWGRSSKTPSPRQGMVKPGNRQIRHHRLRLFASLPLTLLAIDIFTGCKIF
jgi:hypothetical protein